MHSLARTVALFAVAVWLGAPQPASAAKEKFQRDKPHVNIGTIGQTDGADAAAGEVASPEATTGGSSAEDPEGAERRVPERLRHKNRAVVAEDGDPGDAQFNPKEIQVEKSVPWRSSNGE